MNNEIKQGDKVRVSKVAPRIYTPDWVDAMFNLVLKVTEVEDDNAMVEFEKRTSYRTVLTAIPCKYLVKVDAEAKEATAPKIKVGDRVEELVSRRSGRVLGIEGDFVVVGIPYDKEKHYWHIDSVELIEPTEQTEADKKPNVGSIKIPVEVASRTAIGTHTPPTSPKR